MFRWKTVRCIVNHISNGKILLYCTRRIPIVANAKRENATTHLRVTAGQNALEQRWEWRIAQPTEDGQPGRRGRRARRPVDSQWRPGDARAPIQRPLLADGRASVTITTRSFASDCHRALRRNWHLRSWADNGRAGVLGTPARSLAMEVNWVFNHLSHNIGILK